MRHDNSCIRKLSKINELIVKSLKTSVILINFTITKKLEKTLKSETDMHSHNPQFPLKQPEKITKSYISNKDKPIYLRKFLASYYIMLVFLNEVQCTQTLWSNSILNNENMQRYHLFNLFSPRSQNYGSQLIRLGFEFN